MRATCSCCYHTMLAWMSKSPFLRSKMIFSVPRLSRHNWLKNYGFFVQRFVTHMLVHSVPKNVCRLRTYRLTLVRASSSKPEIAYGENTRNFFDTRSHAQFRKERYYHPFFFMLEHCKQYLKHNVTAFLCQCSTHSMRNRFKYSKIFCNLFKKNITSLTT